MSEKLLLLSLLLSALLVFGTTATVLADAPAQLQQAETLAKNGQYEQAEAIYQQIVRDDPGSDYAFEAREKLTSLYVTWGKEPQAEAALQQLLSDFSGHNDIAAALWRIAKQYGQAKKYQKADQIHQHNVQNFPDDIYAMKSQAEIVFSHIRDDDDAAADAAVNHLLNVFSQQPTLPTQVYQVAREYEKFKKYDKAFDLYQHDVENFPQDVHAMMSQTGIAKCHIREGDDAAADAAFDKLLSMFAEQPTLREQIHYVARKYEEYEKYDKALELYQYNVESFPNDEYTMRSQVRIVRTHILKGEEAAANAAFHKLLTLFSDQPTLPKEVYKIANKFGEAKNNQRAHQLYQYVIDNWPKTKYAMSAQAGIAQISIALGDDDTAQTIVDNLIADFTDNPDVPDAMFRIADEYYNAAISHKKDGDNSQAEHHYRKAIAVWDKMIQQLPSSPDYTPRAYYCSAVVHGQELGEYLKGIDYHQRVVDNWPEYKYAWHAQFFVGKYYERLRSSGKLSQSDADPKIEEAYQAVVEKYPDSQSAPVAALKLGRVNVERGQWTDAAYYLELFLQEDQGRTPNHVRIRALYDLGAAYEKMGQVDSAIQVYRTVMEILEPQDSRIETVRAKLDNLEGVDK